MGLFDMFHRKDAPAAQPAPATPAPIASEPKRPSDKEIFQSPTLLADWLDRHFLKEFPVESDYQMLPSEENRKALNITFEQRERCLREMGVLRVAGAAAFIKQHQPDEFWLQFSGRVIPHVAAHAKQEVPAVAEAFETYVESVIADTPKTAARTYLRRVYDDNDNYVKMLAGGLGSLGCKFIMVGFECFRDVWFKVVKGMSYESMKTIAEAMEKIQAEKGDGGAQG